MPLKTTKLPTHPQMVQNLTERITQALTMPAWLVQPLSSVVFVLLAVFLVFQLLTANPYGNRVAESLVKRFEESAKVTERAAVSTEKAAQSMADLAAELKALRLAQQSLEARVTKVETHQQNIDSRFHKSYKPLK